MHFRLAVRALLVLAFLGSAPAAGADTCPDSQYGLNATGGALVTVHGAMFEYVAGPTRQVAFDLTAGTVRLRHDGKFLSSVLARDTYTVGGLAPGTLVPLVVEFDVDAAISTIGCGGSNCWGYMFARITHGTDVASETAQENFWSGPPRPVPRVVQLPLVFVAGQPETIEFSLAGGYASEFQTVADGTIRFLVLPECASISSCFGYAAIPTPAVPESWGGVKAAYR